jgi:hypothetical protein
MESKAKIFFCIVHEINEGNMSVFAVITNSLSITSNTSDLDSHGRSSFQNSGTYFISECIILI